MWNEIVDPVRNVCNITLKTGGNIIISFAIMLSNGVEKRCLTFYREGSIITKVQKSKSKNKN